MKKKIVLSFICGIVVSGCITAYAVTKYNASEISFNSNHEGWNPTNLEDAINDLYINKGGSSLEINDLKISIDENGSIKYEYDGKEIYPIYWYGYFPTNIYSGAYLNRWTENNNTTRFNYNEDYIKVTRVVNNGSYSHGGFTTPNKINLTEFNSYHALVNNSTANFYMQYVNNTGDLGSNYSANENGHLTLVNKNVTEKTEFVSNISSLKASYYVGMMTKGEAGTLDIYALWLEK